MARWEGSSGPLSEIDARLARRRGNEKPGVFFFFFVSPELARTSASMSLWHSLLVYAVGRQRGRRRPRAASAWLLHEWSSVAVPLQLPLFTPSLFLSLVSLSVSLPLLPTVPLPLSDMLSSREISARPADSWWRQNIATVRSNQCTTLFCSS